MKKIAIVGYGLNTLSFANLEVVKRLKQENIEVEFISPEQAEEINSTAHPKLTGLRPPKLENIIIEEKLFMPPTTRRERRANQRKNKNKNKN